MSETDKVEIVDQECQTSKKDKPVIYPQLIASFTVIISLFVAALSYAWPAVTLLHFDKKFPNIRMTAEQRSWVVTALPLGSCFGAITPAFLADYIGRKWLIFLTSIPPIFAWILIYFADKWEFLLIARLIAGFLIGAIFTVVPQYNSEIVDTKIRGASNLMMVVLMNLGYVATYGIGPLLDGKMLALICSIPAILLVFLIPWLPESPYYYLKKNKEKDAELSLMWLRRVRNNKDALSKISEFVEMEKGGRVTKLFTDQVNRRSFLLVLLLLAGQQFSGLVAIQAYIEILLSEMKIQMSIEMILLILGVITLISSLIATITVDRFGRKSLYLISTYAVALCAIVLGTYFLLRDMKFDIKKFSIVPVVAVVAYHIAYNLGVASIPAVVVSEIFPMNVKIFAGSIANTAGAIFSMIVSKAFEPVVTQWGYKTIFYIFGIIEIIVATVVIFWMPETSRKSLAEIQHMLRDSANKGEKENKETEEA